MHEPGKTGEDLSETVLPPSIPLEVAATTTNSPVLPVHSQPFNDRMFQEFIGPDGLRPIWRLFLYFALARFTYLVLDASFAYLDRFEIISLWLQLAAQIVLVGAAFIPALLLARVEKRSFGEYGFPLRNAFGKLFWLGAIWGIAALSTLMLALQGAHAFTIYRLALHGSRILKFGVFWGFLFLVVAFGEEFLMRGYSQFTLSQATGFWPAGVVLSIAFGVSHLWNPGETWNGMAAAAGIGFFFCLTLRRTNSLWFAVGFHAAWDWGESYFYSVPDSGGMVPGHLLKSSLTGPHWLGGGSVGPEGSIFIFPLLIILWVMFDRIYPVHADSKGLDALAAD